MKTLLVLSLLVNSIYSYGIIHHDGGLQCTARYEYRHQLLKDFTSCDELIEHSPICGEIFKVAYHVHPPYVWKEDGKVVGVLPDMIRGALESCCYNCQKLEFIGPFEPLEKFTKNASIAIPVQTSLSSHLYFGHEFVHMVEVKGVSMLGPAVKHDPNKMAMTIFSSVFNTWPLFVIGFTMAIVAGIGIWILDSKENSDDFPDAFPRGAFEGFWWAFISMTTVGYGDRTPKSTRGRIFAALWIICGITLFSMYTATLTSSLTTAVINSHDISLYRKTIGVLNTTTTGVAAAFKINAKYKGYHEASDLGKALMTREIEVAALDENIANHFIDDLVEDYGIKDLALYQRIEMSGISYGMVAFNESVAQIFKSFYESNDDQRDIMLKESLSELEKHDHGALLSSNTADASEMFTSMKMFTKCLITLIVIGTLLVAITLFTKRLKLRSKKRTKKVTINDDELPMTNSISNNEHLIRLADQLHQRLIESINHKKN